MSILIVSHLFEPSVNKVIAELDRKNVSWERLNSEEFPLFSEGEINISSEGAYGIIRTNSGLIDTRAIKAVWLRRLSKPAVLKNSSDRDKDFIRNECGAFLNGFFDLIEARWMNDRNAERAATKTRQLLIALECGFNIPPTLMSNSTNTIKKFATEIGGEISFKPISGFSPVGADFSAQMQEHYSQKTEIEIEKNPKREFEELVFCQKLSEENLHLLDSVKLCPVTFQKYIEKLSDIRVTVVNDEIFACRIKSQSNPETRTDFRRMALLENLSDVEHENINLPTDIERNIHRLMNKLGLVFGCIDLLETDEGQFIFLEVNPSGQWLWIESVLKYPISARIADYLSSTS